LIRDFLNIQYGKFNQVSFIENDPIKIPHLFTKKQDIEIAAFFTATIAWGQRKTILKSAERLMQLMDYQPFSFIKEHSKSDLKILSSFCHRTFQPQDLLYFIRFLKHHYSNENSLETAFLFGDTQEKRLDGFKEYFFSLENPLARTKKHIASPKQNSSCKRLNMFLRWMVRKDDSGVDFGIWNNIGMSELICPLDVHVGRVARELKILKRKQDDWKAATELTEVLKSFDPDDPVKYDFALFGTGIEDKYSNL